MWYENDELLSGRYIQSCSAESFDCGNGLMKVKCRITAARRMPRLGVTCIRIRDQHGADVATIWNTDTFRDSMTGYDRDKHVTSEGVVLPPGTYTAIVTFYAKNGVGSDSRTYRTEPVTIQ